MNLIDIALLCICNDTALGEAVAEYSGMSLARTQPFRACSASAVILRKDGLESMSWIDVQVYSQDPVIVSWNLINEPRCDALGCNKNIQSWVGEMAPYLKSLDPNHLITVGTSFSSSLDMDSRRRVCYLSTLPLQLAVVTLIAASTNRTHTYARLSQATRDKQ